MPLINLSVWGVLPQDIPPQRCLLEEMCSLGWPWVKAEALLVSGEVFTPDSAVGSIPPHHWVHVTVEQRARAVRTGLKLVRAVNAAEEVTVGEACVLCLRRT